MMPAGTYRTNSGCGELCTTERRYDLKTCSIRISVSDACLGIVSFRGWGVKIHGIFFWRIVTACTTVRGKVASPTHHQDRINDILEKIDIFDGSKGGEVEYTRATSIAREPSAFERVIVESMGAFLVTAGTGGGFRSVARGSIAVKEYLPCRELKTLT